jgi:PEP-CTERM motif
LGVIFMRRFIKAGLMAAATVAGLSSATAQAAETLTVPFTQAEGAATVGLYSGTVHVTVSGTGFSNGALLNDAFYMLYNQTPDASGYYQLAFGTSTLVPFDNANAAFSSVVGGRPAYNSDHYYDFFLNTGSLVPTQLHFGVTDGQFSDNGGEFSISIDGGVPEPATWAMMILGMGMIGAAVRRKSLGALPA